MPLHRCALIVLALLFAAAPPARGQSTAAPKPQAPDLAEALAAIERTVEQKRQQLRVPGVAVAIVKDDKVVLQKGFGLRDLERERPVTPDTLFAIGSCSKAFTAMAAVMSEDAGTLSLDDPPRKHLPYFKLQDAEADAKITVRDLLIHTSGLDRTDISWYTGVLDREEAIRVAGLAKPTALFGAKFQYQNSMYSAAGEVVARANRTSWEEFIAARIFRPLGMGSSSTSVKEMTKASDFAVGYALDEGKARKAILRDLANIAPAGAINSNVKDMSQWVRLMLGGGVFEGTRLVSEKGFGEIVRKRISMGGPSDYALGWMLHAWHGHRIVSHGGGIDGFNALVELLPDRKLGLVVLTNVSGSGLPPAIREAVWSGLAGRTEAPVAKPGDVLPQKETGTYAFGDLKVEITFRDGKLHADVAGQPRYELIPLGGRRYKLGAPAPDGFFMTFRPVKEKESETELYLEQPQGNATLTKAAPAKDGPGLKREEGAATPSKADLTIDELMAKAIDAAGGEANLRKRESMVLHSTLDLENQGLTGESVVYAQAPNRWATTMTLIGLGKTIGTQRSYFDGAKGGSEASFAQSQPFGGRRLDDARIAADFYGILYWKTLFKTVTLKEKSKLGEEEVYVVVKTPEKGSPVTEYLSAKTFLSMRQDRALWLGTSQAGGVGSESYGDYRPVDGVMIPFHTVTQNPTLGRIVARVKEVRFNVEIPAEKLRASTP